MKWGKEYPAPFVSSQKFFRGFDIYRFHISRYLVKQNRMQNQCLTFHIARPIVAFYYETYGKHRHEFTHESHFSRHYAEGYAGAICAVGQHQERRTAYRQSSQCRSGSRPFAPNEHISSSCSWQQKHQASCRAEVWRALLVHSYEPVRQ